MQDVVDPLGAVVDVDRLLHRRHLLRMHERLLIHGRRVGIRHLEMRRDELVLRAVLQGRRRRISVGEAALMCQRSIALRAWRLGVVAVALVRLGIVLLRGVLRAPLSVG